MINFNPLELKDREVFSKYLGEYGFYTYEYTFLTLYLWRDMCRTELGIMDDTMIIKKTNPATGDYFMQPLGYKKENLKEIVLRLKEIREATSGFGSLFADIEAQFLEELQAVFGESIVFCEDTDNFDYIYDAKELISLAGNKFHRKKNQYNQFIHGYRYELKELNEPGVWSDCIEFAKDWYNTRDEKTEQLTFELESIEDVLTHKESLNMVGIAVYVNNTIVGFAIGERANESMGIVHIEKGDLEYHGIYSFINKTLAEKYFGDITYINRQEDMGLPGLRKAKMAYQPVRLEKKYIVDLI